MALFHQCPTVGPTYRLNSKDLRKYLIPGTRCCCPQKKRKKNQLLASRLTQKWVPQKNRENKIIFAPAPLFARMPESRESLPHCLLSPSSVSHAPFCTLLCFHRMMYPGLSQVLKYCVTHRSGIWLLMCPKADKGASLGRGYLNVVADVPQCR